MDYFPQETERTNFPRVHPEEIRPILDEFLNIIRERTNENFYPPPKLKNQWASAARESLEELRAFGIVDSERQVRWVRWAFRKFETTCKQSGWDVRAACKNTRSLNHTIPAFVKEKKDKWIEFAREVSGE